MNIYNKWLMRSSGERVHQASNDEEKAVFRIMDVVRDLDFGSIELRKAFDNLSEEQKIKLFQEAYDRQLR